MNAQRNNDLYFKNLDGLRAIAAFSVISAHFSNWFTYPKTIFYDVIKSILSFGGDGGALGVTFFFILSGFLITYLLFNEQTYNGSINIRFFYFRRIVRIWPLYYLTLLVGFGIYPLILLINGQNHTENASIFLYSIFAVNFDHIYNGNPSTGMLGVQWSVAIEEQFYLIWPIIFYFFSKRKIFPFLLILIILISELFFVKAENWDIAYYHLISNFRFLAYGALLAYLCYFKNNWIDTFFKYLSPISTLVIYIISITMMFYQQSITEAFASYKYLYHIFSLLFFGFVIIEQNFSTKSFFKIGSFRILGWLGKISYGLYLTHMIAIYVALGIFSNSDTRYVGLEIIFSLTLTILISYLSYEYIESFFLSLKSKFPSNSKNTQD